jgi:hypothetical protein
MNWERIKAFGRRREVWLLVGGLFLVLLTYQFFFGLSYRGPVTLEYMGYVAKGTNRLDGTIMAFRLSNRSGGPICYRGTQESLPACRVLPMVADEHRVKAESLVYPLELNGQFVFGWQQEHVLENGERRTLYVVMDMAEQSWLVELDYLEGNEARLPHWLPEKVQKWMVEHRGPRTKKIIRSEPVHRLIPRVRGSRPGFSDWSYFMTGQKTNQNGRVTGKMEAVWKQGKGP